MINEKKIILFLLLLTPLAHARRYQYYLDPNHAEEILAGVVLRDRLSQSDWLKIIKGNKDKSYTIRPGDNLWNISAKLFGDAFLWRKLWQVNQGVFNPHELDAGRMLAYYREEPLLYGKDTLIPVIKLLPGNSNNANDIDNDSIVNIGVKQKHRISSFILDEDEILGEVTGGYTEKSLLRNEDELYLYFNDQSKVKAGDTYLIAHEEKNISSISAAGLKLTGSLMTLVGEVKVIIFKDDLIQAEIVSMFRQIQRGDIIVSMKKTVSWDTSFHPPSTMTAKIIIGEEPASTVFSQGGLVLVDRGKEGAMKEGYLFRIFKDTDPFTGKKNGVEPSFKGEIQIIFVGKTASLGFITRNTEPILIGDVLVPYQTFENPPPPLHKNNESVEIN